MKSLCECGIEPLGSISHGMSITSDEVYMIRQIVADNRSSSSVITRFTNVCTLILKRNNGQCSKPKLLTLYFNLDIPRTVLVT